MKTLILNTVPVTGNFCNAKIRLNESLVALRNLELYVNKFYGRKHNYAKCI